MEQKEVLELINKVLSKKEKEKEQEKKENEFKELKEKFKAVLAENETLKKEKENQLKKPKAGDNEPSLDDILDGGGKPEPKPNEIDYKKINEYLNGINQKPKNELWKEYFINQKQKKK